MFGKTDEATILATLTSTLNDSINGYRESAGHSEAPYLKQFFQEMADEREAVAGELRAEVSRRGGEPDTDGSTAGYLHQRFLRSSAPWSRLAASGRGPPPKVCLGGDRSLYESATSDPRGDGDADGLRRPDA